MGHECPVSAHHILPVSPMPMPHSLPFEFFLGGASLAVGQSPFRLQTSSPPFLLCPAKFPSKVTGSLHSLLHLIKSLGTSCGDHLPLAPLNSRPSIMSHHQQMYPCSVLLAWLDWSSSSHDGQESSFSYCLFLFTTRRVHSLVKCWEARAISTSEQTHIQGRSTDTSKPRYHLQERRPRQSCRLSRR